MVCHSPPVEEVEGDLWIYLVDVYGGPFLHGLSERRVQYS